MSSLRLPSHLLRTFRPALTSTSISHPSSLLSLQSRFYASESPSSSSSSSSSNSTPSSSASEKGTGIQKQTDKNARPVILEHAPPIEESEDVKKHNEEFEHRPDRAANKITDEDDKVSKDFWQGQGGTDRKP